MKKSCLQKCQANEYVFREIVYICEHIVVVFCIIIIIIIIIIVINICACII